MNGWLGILLGGFITLFSLALGTTIRQTSVSPRKVVTQFLQVVRSGMAPERASEFMAEQVLAHQLNAEALETIKRTPQQYAEHMREFQRVYGQFELVVDELLTEGDKVYVRWHQNGIHVGPIDIYAPTNQPVTELASAVYRVTNGKIVAYWIQVDRWGTDAQLRANAVTAQKKN